MDPIRPRTGRPRPASTKSYGWVFIRGRWVDPFAAPDWLQGGPLQMLISWAARGIYCNPCTSAQVEAHTTWGLKIGISAVVCLLSPFPRCVGCCGCYGCWCLLGIERGGKCKSRCWFQIFLLSSLLGEMIKFGEHFFQLGWFNHQLEMETAIYRESKPVVM